MHFKEEDLSILEKFLDNESKLSTSLDRALRQVEEGKVVLHMEVRKKYGKWL